MLMRITNGPIKMMDLREMKAVLTKWQKGLEDYCLEQSVLGES